MKMPKNNAFHLGECVEKMICPNFSTEPLRPLFLPVLSICSTCAHAQFDTVINLPKNPDSPNPSGFSGNSIGDNSGIFSNTQLNCTNKDGLAIHLRAST